MIINGQALADKILEELKARIKKEKLSPTLAIVSVGYHEPSYFYFRKIETDAKAIGINVEQHKLVHEAPQEQVLATIQSLNENAAINGILLQFPLPPQLQEPIITSAIAVHKDVDGFNPANRDALLQGKPHILPPAIAAIAHCIKSTGTALKGKQAVLLVRSATFGAPLKKILDALCLTSELMIIDTEAQLHTRITALKIKNANIVVSALGLPGSIQENNIKPGAVLIDLGFTKKNNHIMGDMTIPANSSVPNFITPVPGGVGPVTSAMLLKNVVTIANQEARN